MNYKEYLEYLKYTTVKVYPKYIQNDIVKDMMVKGIIFDSKDKVKAEADLTGRMDINGIAEEERLLEVLNKKVEAVKLVEELEFTKSYRYSAIFKYDELKDDKLKLLIESGNVFLFTTNLDKFDELSEIAKYPTMYSTSNNILLLKFNYKFERTHPVYENKLYLKYPVIAAIFPELKIAEIRLDRVSGIFKDSEDFYDRKIRAVKSWLNYNLEMKFENTEFEGIIDYIVKAKIDEVKLITQNMSFKSGGKATLDVGANEDFTLPLLGELKNLIKNNEEEFKKAPSIKSLLDDFIQEIEETTNLPWVKVCWLNEKKVKQIIVSFSHNYMNQGYSFLQHNGEETGMERMNYVAKYLIENRELGEEK